MLDFIPLCFVDFGVNLLWALCLNLWGIISEFKKYLYVLGKGKSDFVVF
jgi:hypothetical protein